MPREALPFWAYVDKSNPDGCWPWTGGRSSEGYGNYRCEGRTQKAHRLAWRLATGSDAGERCVCHRCDNPPCVNPAHLFLGTVAENNKDRAAKGRSKGTFQTGAAHPAKARPGERHWRAKLTDEQVREIRAKAGEPDALLAEEFGVHPSTIGRIKRREWRKEVL